MSEILHYLRLRLIDAQGRERIKLSRLRGDRELGWVRDQEYFKRSLITDQLQMPAEAVQKGKFASLFAQRVVRKTFSGVVALDLNLAVFERSFRPLPSRYGLSTFLFDDRGPVIGMSLGSLDEENLVRRMNLSLEAQQLLARPADAGARRSLSISNRSFASWVFPVEEFISFLEPVPGEN